MLFYCNIFTLLEEYLWAFMIIFYCTLLPFFYASLIKPQSNLVLYQQQTALFFFVKNADHINVWLGKYKRWMLTSEPKSYFRAIPWELIFFLVVLTCKTCHIHVESNHFWCYRDFISYQGLCCISLCKFSLIVRSWIEV